MARLEYGRHKLVTAVPDDPAYDVGADEWNGDSHEQLGVLGFDNPTETLISVGVLTPTNSATVIVVGAESTTVDTLDILTITDYAENDIVLLFATIGDTITVTHEFGGSGQFTLGSAADKDLSSVVPLALIRRGTQWYEWGGAGIPSGTKAQYDAALSDGDFAFLNQANIFTLNQQIERTGSFPTFTFDRPEVVANSTVIATIKFDGLDDASNPTEYGRIEWIVRTDDDAGGQETANFNIQARVGSIDTKIIGYDGFSEALTLGYGDVQIDQSRNLSLNGATQTQKLAGDAGGLTYTVPDADTHDFVVDATTGLSVTETSIIIPATNKIFLDGGGNTSIREGSADNLVLEAGGRDMLSVNATNTTFGASATANEGGEIILKGEGANTDINFDNQSGNARIFANNAAVRSLQLINSGAGVFDMIIPPTGKYRLDGSTAGNTYIRESTADNLQIVAGGVVALTSTTTGTFLLTGQQLWFDGGIDTSIEETVADDLLIKVGNQNAIRMNEDGTEVDVVIGANNVLLTTATQGFLHIPNMAGAPTGNPVDYTGKTPIVYDDTNNVLYANTDGTGTGWATVGASEIWFMEAGFANSVPFGRTVGISPLTGLFYNSSDKLELIRKVSDESIEAIKDQFTGYANDTEFDAQWVQITGADVNPNATNDRIDWNLDNVANDDHGVYADLGASIGTGNFLLRCKVHITTLVTSPAVEMVLYIGVADNQSGAQVPKDFLGISITNNYAGTGNLRFSGNPANGISLRNATETQFTTAIPASGQDRWIIIKRTSTSNFDVAIYSDEYSTLIESKSIGISSSYTGLRYVVIESYDVSGADGTNIGYVDNIEFYNGITSI